MLIEEVRLAPGEFFFGEGHTRVHTLLGSCVAITLWHPQRCIGGMCHYLLPSRSTNERLRRGYFADDAVNMFLEDIRASVTRPDDYEVKVFGGGNMLDGAGDGRWRFNVPEENVAAGISLLERHGFRVKATDVGGTLKRNIVFELWNGDVWVKRGPGAASDRSA